MRLALRQDQNIKTLITLCVGKQMRNRVTFHRENIFIRIARDMDTYIKMNRINRQRFFFCICLCEILIHIRPDIPLTNRRRPLTDLSMHRAWSLVNFTILSATPERNEFRTQHIP